MKKITLLLFCLITICSQAQTIVTARAAVIGTSVSIKGIVTNGSELGNIRYVQDATGGISIYGTNLTSVQRGDSINATGTLTNYNNLLEITPVAFTVVATSKPLPTPALVTPNTMIEPYEAQVVKINNGIFALGGSTFAGNTNYNFTSGGQTTQIRISTTSTLVGTIIPNSSVNVSGIVSQFCSTPATGCTTGYQLLVRDQNDIVNNSSIYLTAQPSVSAISTSAFNLAWGTNIAGASSYIQIGASQTLSGSTTTLTASSATTHTIAVSGLTTATIYYVRVYSINGSDTAKSSIKAYCTQSNSSGIIKTYFTRSVDNTVATAGNNAKPLITLIDDTLIAYINRAKSELEIAIYNWDNSTAIANAVNAAAARGVKVRVIYDGSTGQTGISALSSQCKLLGSAQGANYTIMHNKFVVIDVNSPANAIVWTGSTNWTANQLNVDANNVIIFQDQSLARGYKVEFDEMWGDTVLTTNANVALSKFGQFKTDNTPHEYIIGGKRVEQFFSPSDNTNSMILSTINTANSTLDFSLMLNTRSDLATKIQTQFQTMGLTGKGLMDDTTNTTNLFNYMKTGMGAGNIAVDSHSWILHHKYMIIDQANLASDPLVLTGSHNWSTGADTKNDENTVVVHNANIANQYYQEFNQRWTERNTAGVGVEELQNNGKEMQLYPNPADNYVKIIYNLEGSNDVSISIYDYTGKKIEVIDTKGDAGINTKQLDLAGLSAGIYLVEVISNEFKQTQKLIIN